jgi:V/A-type H+/Na+-transporting ATPase subunit A
VSSWRRGSAQQLSTRSGQRASRDERSCCNQGESISQIMQVTGEEGVTLEDFLLWQKATAARHDLPAAGCLRRVDASTPLERQKTSFDLVFDLLHRDPAFTDKTAARDYYTQLTGLYRNLNYAATGSPTYRSFLQQIQALSGTPTPNPVATP